MKQADNKIIEKLLEMCKYIKWKNVESFDKAVEKESEKNARNTNT